MNFMGRYLSTDVTLLKLKHTEAIVYCKLKEWLYIAIRSGVNFDGEKYFVNRTYPNLLKDLNLEFTRNALLKIIGKIEEKGLIKIEIDTNNNKGNKYYFHNQENLINEMHAAHFHKINLSKVVTIHQIDENDELIDSMPSANSLPPSANSLPPSANSLPLSLYQNNKRNRLINIKEDFDKNNKVKTLFPEDLNKIRKHWIDIGLQYKSTAWEFNDLRKIGETIASHGADVESILKAITAYSSVINNPDSFYTYKHSMTSFFGSKGAWEKFLDGNYFEGQFNKNGLTDYDTDKRKQEILNGLNQYVGF